MSKHGGALCRRIIAAAVFAASAGSAGAQEQEDAFDPAKLDLARLIECRAQVPDYNELASWIQTEPQVLHKLGWKQLESGNPFLNQYEMDRPVAVFGTETKDIAFAGSAILAVLPGDKPAALAGRLGVDALIDNPEKFMGEKVIAEATDDTNEMMTIKTRISLNVSTVESHPGKVLAGCSYNFTLDVKE